MQDPTPIVSVVIPTYNRPHLLPAAIKHLRAQAAEAPFEIIVVDNSSNNETEELMKQYDGDHVIRSIRSTTVGLNAARNTGMAAARGTYIAFIDDDERADPGWVSAIIGAFTSRSTIGCVGGPIELQWDAPRPVWLHDRLLPYLSAFRPFSNSQILDTRTMLVGGNIAFRTELLRALGGFDSHLGYLGSTSAYNDEVPVQFQLEKQGYTRFYEERMSVKHLVPVSRVTPWWFLRRLSAQGVSDARIEAMGYFFRHPFITAGTFKERLRELLPLLLPTPATMFLAVVFVIKKWSFLRAKRF